MLPKPEEPYEYLRGFLRTTAISSCSVFAGTLGCTAMTIGPMPSTATGAKSLTGS